MQIRRSEVRAITGATTYASFAVLPLFLTGTLAIAMREDLNFGAPRVGIAAAIFTASSAIASVPGGNLTERIGVRWATRISGALAIACLGGTALFATSWWWLVTFLVDGPVSDPPISMSVTRVLFMQHLPS